MRLTIYSLGKFKIQNDIGLLNEDSMHSDMMTKLFIYLLLHRDRPIAVQEICDALWNEEETDNPAGALKNLMYRLRNTLKKTLGEYDYILTSRGVYSWNPDIAVSFDIEMFEKRCEEAKKTEENEQKMKLYEEALELYQGDFMSNIMDRHWLVTISAYYHSMALTATKSLLELYMEEELFEKVENLCIVTLEKDAADEDLYCYMIMSLIYQHKQKLAMKYYDTARKALYDALGVKNTSRLQKVHKELLKMQKGSKAEGLEKIYNDMTEPEKPAGAYICGYPVFKEIYRLEARRVTRLGEAEYMILFTLKFQEGALPDNDQMERFLMNQAMEQLEAALKKTLRMGDVAARYTDSQFVALLPACTYESCFKVADRVQALFREKSKGKRFILQAEFEEVKIDDSFGAG